MKKKYMDYINIDHSFDKLSMLGIFCLLIVITGVFEIDKTATGAIEMGTEVYFDGTGITDTKGDDTPLAGYAAQAAAASDTVILVKLGG